MSFHKAKHWKNSIAKRTIFWSSEPENIAIRPMLWYGPQNYKSIGETAIQVRWYDSCGCYPRFARASNFTLAK